MAVSPEVEAIAQAQAAQDRDLLAQLIREGKVQRVPTKGRTQEEFVLDIESRVAPRRVINLAIRPKRKRR